MNNKNLNLDYQIVSCINLVIYVDVSIFIKKLETLKIVAEMFTQTKRKEKKYKTSWTYRVVRDSRPIEVQFGIKLSRFSRRETWYSTRKVNFSVTFGSCPNIGSRKQFSKIGFLSVKKKISNIPIGLGVQQVTVDGAAAISSNFCRHFDLPDQRVIGIYR